MDFWTQPYRLVIIIICIIILCLLAARRLLLTSAEQRPRAIRGLILAFIGLVVLLILFTLLPNILSLFLRKQ